MIKKILISTATAALLTTGFTGCAGGGLGTPSAKSAQGNAYLNYKQNRPKAEAIKVNIPIAGMDDVNNKLKVLSVAYKLSSISADSVFANDDIDNLMKKNEEKIAKLEEEIKNKPQAEQEKALLALLDELEQAPEFKKAQKDVEAKHAKTKAEMKKLGIDTLKEFIMSKLDSKKIMANKKIASMGFMDKANIAKEIKKVSDIYDQITSTYKGVDLVVQRKGTEKAFKDQDAQMYIKNQLQNSLTENLSEDEAVDSKAS